jgi:hypothetical protein
MDGAARGVLRDLFAAAKPISDQQSVGRGGANSGEQNALAEHLGDVEFLTLEAEGAGHAAAARIEQRDLGSSAAKDRDLIPHFHQGFVMAVAVKHNFAAGQRGWSKIRNVTREEFAEQKGLVTQALGARILREKVDELIAKDARAAGFEEDEEKAGVDLGRAIAQDLFQIGAGLLQKAEIVERAAAADVLARDFGREAGAFEDARRSVEGLRVVVVVPRVRPQD